ncbi:MAG: polymorphic toxin type 44 domain-containing protein [Actinomycetaceae bacterium]|nr:polymorphic toxin type 44 domain-containing protein [Actinomycetaceae bacterium]
MELRNSEVGGLMKSKTVFGVVLFLIFSLQANTMASAEDLPGGEVGIVQQIYDDFYSDCGVKKSDKIIDNCTAYSFLVHSNYQLDPLKWKFTIDKSSLSLAESEVLDTFLSKISILLRVDAIRVMPDSRIVEFVPEVVEPVSFRAPVFELMQEARNHANTLKSVHDSVPAGEPRIVAGKYFASRVKTGGAWDYKSFLGTRSVYYEPTLRAYMTGEQIGNFHYGYSGSSVFTPFELKGAAGFYQIVSGTSDWGFWTTYFDDPSDQKDIDWGINKFNAEH